MASSSFVAPELQAGFRTEEPPKAAHCGGPRTGLPLHCLISPDQKISQKAEASPPDCEEHKPAMKRPHQMDPLKPSLSPASKYQTQLHPDRPVSFQAYKLKGNFSAMGNVSRSDWRAKNDAGVLTASDPNKKATKHLREEVTGIRGEEAVSVAKA